jgi:hypothetical protein
MRLFEFTSSAPDEEVTLADLIELERYLDALYNRDNINFEFTRHFLDRVNDQRNNKQITTGELFKMFGKAEQKYGAEIAKMGNDAQAVINDVGAQINSPFVLNWNPRSKMFDLVTKTVMRKANFATSNPKLKV